MKRIRVFLAAVAAAGFMSVAATARSEEPAHFTYSPPPPGTVLQSQVVYLAGQAMHSQWRGVLSKKLVGTSAGMPFYQWYLSIYAIDGAVYELKYQSPRDGGPFDTLQHTSDASMWYPAQSGSIVGAAQLMGPGIEQFVVATQQVGADCGSADVSIFGYDAKSGKVVRLVTVENNCGLSATIVHSPKGDSLALSGPYYGPHAANCCPTKSKASAILTYTNGKWVEKPNYFYMRKMPNRVGGCGACAAASRPSAMTRRVSSGSMMPSSHRRAVE